MDPQTRSRFARIRKTVKEEAPDGACYIELKNGDTAKPDQYEYRKLKGDKTKGRLKRQACVTGKYTYHDRIDIKISREKYNEIKAVLDRDTGKTGDYRRLFYNCAHYVLDIACGHGISPFPKTRICSPDRLALRIRGIARKGGVQPGAKAIPLLQRLEAGL